MKGFESMSTIPYKDAHAAMLKTPDGTPHGQPHSEQLGEAHPVSCVDCHDPDTMSLRVTRPGFVLGIQALADERRSDAAPAERRALAQRRPPAAL